MVGKNVTIDGLIYEIQNSTELDGTEVLVLSRELPVCSPSTIYDLGYETEDDIYFSDEEIQACKEELDTKINEPIELASIMRGGTIKISECIFHGLSVANQDQAKIVFIKEVKPDQEPTVQLIQLDILVDAVLVAQRFNKVKHMRELIALKKENQSSAKQEESSKNWTKKPSKNPTLDDYVKDLENELDPDEVQKIRSGVRQLLRNRTQGSDLFGAGFDTVFKDMDKLFKNFGQS